MQLLTDPLGYFALEFPEGWQRRADQGVTVLASPLGLIYVSGARHVRGQQEDFGRADFLFRFLQSIGLQPNPDDVTSSTGTGCQIYCYQCDLNGAFWSHYSVTDDETVLLVSYTCVIATAGNEAALVDEVVRSIRLFHSGPVH